MDQEIRTVSNRGMRLTVELGSPLLIQFEGREERLRSIFVGMDPPAYLIIQTPRSSDMENCLYEGNGVIVRYLCLGNVYGFRSELLHHITEPFRLMFLSYPGKVETLNLRKHSRVDSHIPATLHLNQEKIEGVIMDISVKGCRFSFNLQESNLALQAGQKVQLSFPLLGLEGEKHVEGEVRSITQDSNKASIGVQFDELDADVSAKVETYVKRVMEFDSP